VKRELLRQPGFAVDVSEDRFGLPNRMMTKNGTAKAQISAAVGHPLQSVEDAHALESMRQELAMAKRMCGSQLSAQLAMELQACAQVGRYQCPIPSSRLMWNTLMGTDDMVTLDDVYKNPDNVEGIQDMSPQLKKD